ncbi:MAG: copper chaperone Copz family protein [Thermoanaerobaculia bacterium]
MSSCCAGASCEVASAAADECRLCGNRGVTVDRITLKALLTPAALRTGVPPKPHICSTAGCSVVYFDSEAGVKFTEQDLIVPVHAKHADDPDVLVCYCFDMTPRSVAARIDRDGRISASADIAAEVKAGHCACEVRNPKGSCCLGDVIRIEKRKSHGHTPQDNDNEGASAGVPHP